MNKLDEDFQVLVKKMNRLTHYISKFDGEMYDYLKVKYRADEIITDVIEVLRCEGVKPSHNSLFFLYDLYDADGIRSNNRFMSTYLRQQRDVIHEVLESLMHINDVNDVKDNGGDLDGTLPQAAADLRS